MPGDARTCVWVTQHKPRCSGSQVLGAPPFPTAGFPARDSASATDAPPNATPRARSKAWKGPKTNRRAPWRTVRLRGGAPAASASVAHLAGADADAGAGTGRRARARARPQPTTVGGRVDLCVGHTTQATQHQATAGEDAANPSRCSGSQVLGGTPLSHSRIPVTRQHMRNRCTAQCKAACNAATRGRVRRPTAEHLGAP